MATWIVINIGNREYAIKSEFVTGITELKTDNFIVEVDTPFVRGRYNIFNVDINVLDGYKITRETSKNETKLSFSKRMTDLWIAFENNFESTQLLLMTHDKYNKAAFSEVSSKIGESLQDVTDIDIKGDKYLNKQIDRLKENAALCYGRILNILSKAGSDENFSMLKSLDELELIKAEATRRIYDSVNNIIEYYNSSISEMCVVFKTKDYSFGMTIDGIEFIQDIEEDAKIIKRTILSTGIIKINDKEYNVLDLTKLGKVAYKK